MSDEEHPEVARALGRTGFWAEKEKHCPGAQKQKRLICINAIIGVVT